MREFQRNGAIRGIIWCKKSDAAQDCRKRRGDLLLPEEAAAVPGRDMTLQAQRQPLPACAPAGFSHARTAEQDFPMPEQRLPQLRCYAIIFRLKIKGAGDNELHRF